MARAKRGTKSRRRHKRLLKRAEGFYGGRHRLFRTAKEAVDHAGVYAYEHRRLKKRDFRQLWQIRISAAAKNLGVSYSRLMHGLKVKGILLNRKILADLAISHPADFEALTKSVQ